MTKILNNYFEIATVPSINLLRLHDDPRVSGRGSGKVLEGLGGVPGGSWRVWERFREGPGGSWRVLEGPGGSGRVREGPGSIWPKISI